MSNNPAKVSELKDLITVDLLTSAAKAPIRKHDSAGMDLFSAEDVLIPAGRVRKVDTDIRMYIPKGTYGRICERSGHALRSNLLVKGGVIDHGYAGNIGIILYNHGNESYQVQQGERIAQIIITVIHHPFEVTVNHFDPYLESGSQPLFSQEEEEEEKETVSTKRTKRGGSGFGSTGKF